MARREYGRREIAARLSAKGYRDEVIQECLDELEASGYLSDQRFVEALIHSRRGRGYGPMRVRDDLRQRGIDSERIDSAVDATDSAWLEAARSVYQKRFGGGQPEDTRERLRRMRYLYGRGFTSDQIGQVLDEQE